MTRARASDEGFTLIEVLAALVVFGFLIAGLAEAVRFGLSAYATQQAVIARDDDLDATDRVIGSLLAAIDPSASTTTPSVIGNGHELAFTTTLPVRIGDPATDRADARLAVEHGALVLELLPHRHAVPLDPPRHPEPDRTTLATGIDHVAFAYWNADAHHWTDAWRASLPPSLIRLSFVFANRRRHWPPLIARPILSYSWVWGGGGPPHPTRSPSCLDLHP